MDEEIILYIDNIFINGLPFLSAHGKRLKYAKAVPLRNRSTTELYEALDEVLRLYNGRGFTIKEIHCDHEFKPLMDPVKDMMGVEMHYPPAGDHVPQAERLNRVIRERVCATYHDLPYKNLPEIMWKYLVMIATNSLNWFLAKGGVSKYYSPHTLLRQ